MDAVGTVGGARGLERIAAKGNASRWTRRLDGAIPESDARRERRTDSVRARAGIFEETREADAPESISGGGVRRENAGDETQNGEGKKEEAFGSKLTLRKAAETILMNAIEREILEKQLEKRVEKDMDKDERFLRRRWGRC